MKSPLYHISCTLQIAVGIGLFTVSFLMEYAVLKAFFTQAALIALLLAISLEAGKGLSIIWHRYFILEDATAYPKTTRWWSNAFRGGLVLLSAICSLTWLGVRLDQPALAQIRAADLTQLEEQTKQAREQLAKRTKTLLAQQQADQASEQRELLAPYQSRVERLSRQLDQEMNNVVKGEFIGKRYRALESRLAEAKRETSRLTAELAARYSRERTALQDRLHKRLEEQEKRIDQQYQQRYQQIQQGSYADDQRVHHPMISALVNISQEVLGWSPTPLQFVFFFSLLLSALMELGILQAFETATLSIHPLLRAQHRNELETAIKATELDSKQKQNEMEAAAEIEQIERGFQKTVDAARRGARKFTSIN